MKRRNPAWGQAGPWGVADFWMQFRHHNQLSFINLSCTAMSSTSLNTKMPSERIAQDAEITNHVRVRFLADQAIIQSRP